MLRTKIREEIARNRKRIRKLGPGIITGGAGDDPAGIVTYTVVGATTGFSPISSPCWRWPSHSHWESTCFTGY